MHRHTIRSALWATTLLVGVAHAGPPPMPGVQRTELQRHDLSAPGREVVQARVEVDPGKSIPLHSHPGEEIVYVIEGTWEFRLEGAPTVTRTAGEVLFVPAGNVHTGKNIGEGKAVALATYVVEKGKPFLVLADGESKAKPD